MNFLNRRIINPILLKKCWNGIPPLSTPIKTKENDIVLSGHGSYEFDGETRVPPKFELWILAPPGASISDRLGGALESGEKITKLALLSPKKKLVEVKPTIYKANTMAPNYTLSTPIGLKLKPKSGGPYIIGAHPNQKLSKLWPRIEHLGNLIRLKKGQPNMTIRVFWAACSYISGNKNYVVIHKL